jgi:hypothetical protein
MDVTLLIIVSVFFAVLTTLLWTAHVSQKEAQDRKKTGARNSE